MSTPEKPGRPGEVDLIAVDGPQAQPGGVSMTAVVSPSKGISGTQNIGIKTKELSPEVLVLDRNRESPGSSPP